MAVKSTRKVGSHLFSHLIFASIAGAISAFVVYFITATAPAIEGRLYPVAKATGYNTELAAGGDTTRIYGVMEKYRNCEFISMTAYLTGMDGNAVIAPITVNESIRLRPEGSFEWGPWFIRLPIWEADTHFRVITVHQCHPLWVTRSVFLDTSIVRN